MAEFERGQTFIDLKSSNINQTKAKYFIALSNANYEDDEIICFVMNTEQRMNLFNYDCNKNAGKFIIPNGTFKFIDRDTSIMLRTETYFLFSEILNSSSIKLLEIADEQLQRKIKNCIDFNFIPPKAKKIILDSFK